MEKKKQRMEYKAPLIIEHQPIAFETICSTGHWEFQQTSSGFQRVCVED